MGGKVTESEQTACEVKRVNKNANNVDGKLNFGDRVNVPEL